MSPEHTDDRAPRRTGSWLSGRGTCRRCLPNDRRDGGVKGTCRKGSSVSKSWKEHSINVNTL